MSDTIERFFIATGIGLGIFILLTILLSLLHIPLYWWVYLIIALVSLFLFRKKIKFVKPRIQSIIVLILFLIQIAVFTYGAFQYEWLEDGDPWHHATIVKYISEEKTVFESTDRDTMKYLDPYPPSYGALMSIPYQLTGNMIWTLKVFNVILISLCIPFAYLAFKKIFRDKNMGLLGATILLLTPCFLSHFIWALSLALPIFLFTLYTLEKTSENRKWMWVSVIMVAALGITQPSMTIKLGMMLGLYLLAKMIVHRNFQKHIMFALLFGILLSFIWWGPVIIRWGLPIQNEWYGIYSPSGRVGTGEFLEKNPGIFRLKGTADREYGFSEFVIAKVPNMINNPIGLGYVLAILVGLSVLYLIFDYKNFLGADWKLISLLWVVFTFLGIQGERIPIQFIAFRFWMLFAVACALLVAGVVMTVARRPGVSKYAVIGVILLGIIWTSGVPKYQINTSIWPYGGVWTNSDELKEYLSIDEFVDKGERIFPICHFGTDKLISLDYDTCAWCIDEWDIRDQFFDVSLDESYNAIKQKGYDYMVLDGRCMISYPIELMNAKMAEVVADSRFNILNEPVSIILMELK